MSYLFSNLIFLLLAGFIFNQSIPHTRYNLKDKNGYYFILYTFLSGAFLYAISYSLISFLKDNSALLNLEKNKFLADLYPALSSLLVNNPIPDPVITNASITALILSCWIFMVFAVAQLILPKPIIYKVRKHSLNQVYKKLGTKAEFLKTRLLHGKIALITLRNRKCYVGFIYEVPYMDESEDWSLKILPLRSGYRDSETLNVRLDNDYDSIWQKISNEENEDLGELNQFGIIINWNDIETVSAWIPEIYHNLSRKT